MLHERKRCQRLCPCYAAASSTHAVAAMATKRSMYTRSLRHRRNPAAGQLQLPVCQQQTIKLPMQHTAGLSTDGHHTPATAM